MTTATKSQRILTQALKTAVLAKTPGALFRAASNVELAAAVAVAAMRDEARHILDVETQLQREHDQWLTKSR